MKLDESKLTKGQVRKLNALRKSVGPELGEGVFVKWLAQQAKGKPQAKADPVATKIAEALAPLADDPTVRLGNYGYTIIKRRLRGKASGGPHLRYDIYKNKIKPERA